MTVRVQYKVTNVAISNTDKKKVTITLGTATGWGGNAKFQTEGTGVPLTGKADNGTTTGTAGHIRYSRDAWATAGRTPDARIAAGAIATIEVNCSTELEARKVNGLLSLKDSVKAKHTARPKWHAWFSGIDYDENAQFKQDDPKTWLNITGGGNDNLILKSTSFADGKILENLHIDNVDMTDNNENTSIKVGADPANGKFSDYASALIALEDVLWGMEQHYTKDGGDFANRNIDADLTALEKYNGTATTSNEQVV